MDGSCNLISYVAFKVSLFRYIMNLASTVKIFKHLKLTFVAIFINLKSFSMAVSTIVHCIDMI